MTDKEYNHLVELRYKCYRDRRDRETDITYFTGFNDGYEKGRETLEKENAELKEKCQNRCDESWEEHINLTKAKEIIQSFVYWHTGEDRGSVNSNELVAQAEQFLSEVEK